MDPGQVSRTGSERRKNTNAVATCRPEILLLVMPHQPGPLSSLDDGARKKDGLAPSRAVFLFFIFVFYKNIFLFSKFTGIYPGRPAAGRQELFCKKFAKIFAEKPLEDQPPGSRATGSPTLI